MLGFVHFSMRCLFFVPLSLLNPYISFWFLRVCSVNSYIDRWHGLLNAADQTNHHVEIGRLGGVAGTTVLRVISRGRRLSCRKHCR